MSSTSRSIKNASAALFAALHSLVAKIKPNIKGTKLYQAICFCLHASPPPTRKYTKAQLHLGLRHYWLLLVHQSGLGNQLARTDSTVCTFRHSLSPTESHQTNDLKWGVSTECLSWWRYNDERKELKAQSIPGGVWCESVDTSFVLCLCVRSFCMDASTKQPWLSCQLCHLPRVKKNFRVNSFECINQGEKMNILCYEMCRVDIRLNCIIPSKGFMIVIFHIGRFFHVFSVFPLSFHSARWCGSVFGGCQFVRWRRM